MAVNVTFKRTKPMHTCDGIINCVNPAPFIAIIQTDAPPEIKDKLSPKYTCGHKECNAKLIDKINQEISDQLQ